MNQYNVSVLYHMMMICLFDLQICEYLLHCNRNMRDGFGLDVVDTLLGETRMYLSYSFARENFLLPKRT